MFTYEMLLHNIQSLISEKGLKQKAVANKAGFDEKEFSNMLNGRKLIKPEFIPLIAKSLNVSVSRLYEVKTGSH